MSDLTIDLILNEIMSVLKKHETKYQTLKAIYVKRDIKNNKYLILMYDNIIFNSFDAEKIIDSEVSELYGLGIVIKHENDVRALSKSTQIFYIGHNTISLVNEEKNKDLVNFIVDNVNAYVDSKNNVTGNSDSLIPCLRNNEPLEVIDSNAYIEFAYKDLKVSAYILNDQYLKSELLVKAQQIIEKSFKHLIATDSECKKYFKDRNGLLEHLLNTHDIHSMGVHINNVYKMEWFNTGFFLLMTEYYLAGRYPKNYYELPYNLVLGFYEIAVKTYCFSCSITDYCIDIPAQIKNRFKNIV